MIKIIAFILIVAASLAESCTNPNLSNVRTSVTQDTKLATETAYVIQFSIKCDKDSRRPMFYGEVNGNFFAASSDETGERYQVSWSESNKKATTGQIKVRLFDEEGYGAAKKAQRNNEDLSKVKELTTFFFTHKGAFSHFYVQSELLAVLVFGALFYYAQSIRDSF